MRAALLVISTLVLLGLAAVANAQVQVDVVAPGASVSVDAGRTDVNVGVRDATVSVDYGHRSVYVQACGLFGPSKKELMQRMIDNQHVAMHQAQAAHSTLLRMEVEQARQTELLRQIAGQTARAADNTQRAADAGQDLRQHLLTRPLRDYPALPSDAPRDIRNAPVVAPTLPDLRSSQPLPSDAPGSIRSAPEINIEGPILQGTNGRVYYAKQRPVQTTRKPATQYTNYSLRN